ncbi:hypothetical protein [Nannocystis exedens]|uniref:hypothetical protein n=1 Tax=Nannocystis exedens TaxID=54 RepID=UPI000BBA090B|nr:hypothetical protein [Nannocystis exedens]
MTLSVAQTALAADQYLELEPPKTLTGRGYGYNSISREFVLRQCVQFGNALLDGSGASGDEFKFSSIVSNSQLADEMNLAVNTKFSASMGLVSANASSKVDFFQTTKTNFNTHTILAKYHNVEPMKFVAGDINLKPEYLAMVGTPAFRQQCGDYLVIGEQKGRWFFGTVQLSVRDTLTESKLAASGVIGVDYATMNAEVGVSTINKLKQASNTQDLEIHVTSSGTNSASLSVEQFLQQVQAFPGQNGAKQTFKLMAVPYEDIVANWPVNNPLAPLTSEQKLTKLAEAAWGLTALIDDSDFMIQNAKLFALGTTPAKRDARIAYIKTRRAFYQAQLADMRNRARDCDVDWTGQPACESLYDRWKDFEDFVVAEYDQFPTRYVSECYAARDAGEAIQSKLTQALATTTGQFSNTKGDREMGGGPVNFSANLTFKPDHTGGDPLDVRKLLSTLKIRMEESKADHTTFETTLKTPVFDLAGPTPGETLAQCSYQGTGVKAAWVTADAEAVCGPMKALNKGAYEDCVQMIQNAKYHGMLSGKTGEDPRTETFNKNARGVLTAMKCTVDSNASNDTPMIGCQSIGLRSIQLDLVNRQDVVADKWVAPKKLDVKKLTPLIKPTMQRSNALRKLIAPTPVVAAKAARCGEGLVNVSGQCLPKLRKSR